MPTYVIEEVCCSVFQLIRRRFGPTAAFYVSVLQLFNILEPFSFGLRVARKKGRGARGKEFPTLPEVVLTAAVVVIAKLHFDLTTEEPK